jgi:predicted metal-dependent HD superfamily phosphohydrolase
MAAIADAVLARWLTPAADPAAVDGLRALLLGTAQMQAPPRRSPRPT